jgi:hypothetical protein
VMTIMRTRIRSCASAFITTPVTASPHGFRRRPPAA